MGTTGRIVRSALAASVLLALLAACGDGAGQSGRRTVEASGFTGVSTTAGIDVVVSTSTGWAVDISASPQVMSRIVVEVRGSTLWIGVRAGTAARSRWLASQAQVGVALPSLERLDVTDGSRARLELEEPGTDVAIALSRGSQVSGSIACDGLAIASSGSSVAELSGSAERISLVASDRAKLRLSALETPSMDAILSGGSTAAVAVSHLLVVEASGGSGLSYRGDARVERQTLSGGSWLRKE
jgi:hypothetical protein